MKFKVEHRYATGWADAEWTEEYDGNVQPLRCETQQEAEREIDEFIADTEVEAKRGNLAEAYDRNDYRAVPAEGE